MKKSTIIGMIIAFVVGVPILMASFFLMMYLFSASKPKQVFHYAVSNASNKIATWSAKQKQNTAQTKPPKKLSTEIEAEKTAKIGKHIYYDADSFFPEEERVEGENKALKKYLKSIDKKLDGDVYLTFFMYYPKDDRFEVSACAYINDAFIDYYRYAARSDNDDGFVAKFPHTPIPDPDTSNLINPKTVIPDVKELALQNTDKMLMDRGNAVYGTYILKYTAEPESLFYEFTLNRFSYVNVDAKTGEIVGYYFYNGVVY
ncbi:MAG: hypothetical protein IKN45_02315 [Lachnospiraceae bacterium]|nr:hypothetical protein [Lachnospiraceae bacterium]